VYTLIRYVDVTVTIQTSLEINDVVIDEAQNFTIAELFLIRSLFVLGSSYTLCGDLNQRYDDACISDWREAESVFTMEPDIFYLTRNLRNTKQINAVSLTLIGDQISDPSPVTGPPVRVVTDPNTDYTTLLDELRTSIDHLESPKIVFIGSKPYVDRLVAAIEVVDINAIGGLEYDGAVILVHDLPDSSNSRRSLYVALTRSRWAVTLVIGDDMSMWVKDLLESAPPDCVTVH
jgi:DNA helicase IV